MDAILINGELFTLCGSFSVSVAVESNCPIHVVSFGAVRTVAVRNAQGFLLSSSKLSDGESTCLDEHNGGVMEITSEPSTSFQNRTETAFVSAIVTALFAPKDSGTTLPKLLGELGASRIPPHALQLICANEMLNLFEAGGSVCCTSRKKARARFHRRCPKLNKFCDMEQISSRSAIGEPMWRQCGASFSTMMRQFQKAPSMFKWKSDEEKRTIIARA